MFDNERCRTKRPAQRDNQSHQRQHWMPDSSEGQKQHRPYDEERDNSGIPHIDRGTVHFIMFKRRNTGDTDGDIPRLGLMSFHYFGC